jgi:hypothetical protein
MPRHLHTDEFPQDPGSVDALSEAGPGPIGRDIADLKKDGLVTAAAARLSGTSRLPPLLRAALTNHERKHLPTS